MEMNTRLQVEHPVTEAITGLDLVEWQLRVAAGEPLPLRQDQLRMRGHAIEARICAENPDANFLPATGTLGWRAGRARGLRALSYGLTSVRIDAACARAMLSRPFYDSMIAKLIVWGEDRAQALARLDAALPAPTSWACTPTWLPAPGCRECVLRERRSRHRLDRARARRPVPCAAAGTGSGGGRRGRAYAGGRGGGGKAPTPGQRATAAIVTRRRRQEQKQGRIAR